MAISLQTIFSQVQSDIGDIGFEKLQRKEYLDSANDVLNRISQECRVWTGYYQVVPFPNPIDWTFATIADRDSFIGYQNTDVNKLAFVTADDMYYRMATFLPIITWIPVSPYEMIVPGTLNVKSVIQVVRNGIEAREQSQQSVLNANRAERPFTTNATSFGGWEFNIQKRPDESLAIHFSQKIQEQEPIGVHYVANHGYPLNLWTQANMIPDYLTIALRSGLTLECTRKLYLRGDESLAQKVEVLRGLFEADLLQAKAYTKMFLDENSVLRVEPLRWLAETP